MLVCTRVVCGLGALAAMPALAMGASLLGNSFDGMLYDIDPATGVASNARATGITSLGGLEFDGSGDLFGLDASTNDLFRIDPASGQAVSVGGTGISVTEGGLAYDPVSGRMFGAQATGSDLIYTIDLATGAATEIGAAATDDLSAISFDGSGNLWGIDTGGGTLLEISTADASTISSTPLSLSDLGSLAGLDYDPVTGTMYASVAPVGGAQSLYTLDLATGALGFIGAHGTADLAGLTYIPAPGMVGAAGLVGLAGLRRRR